jgi:hypothetical protein
MVPPSRTDYELQMTQMYLTVCWEWLSKWSKWQPSFCDDTFLYMYLRWPSLHTTFFIHHTHIISPNVFIIIIIPPCQQKQQSHPTQPLLQTDISQTDISQTDISHGYSSSRDKIEWRPFPWRGSWVEGSARKTPRSCRCVKLVLCWGHSTCFCHHLFSAQNQFILSIIVLVGKW